MSDVADTADTMIRVVLVSAFLKTRRKGLIPSTGGRALRTRPIPNVGIISREITNLREVLVKDIKLVLTRYMPRLSSISSMLIYIIPKSVSTIVVLTNQLICIVLTSANSSIRYLGRGFIESPLFT